MPTVAIAGSRATPSGQAGRFLIRTLAALPPGSTILLRSGIDTPPGGFELTTAEVCAIIGLRVRWCQPDPKGGRESVWQRDCEMITDADLVIAFHTLEQTGDTSSGTVAFIDKAIDAGTPAYAYAFDAETSTIQRVGEHDPTNRWAALVPAGQ